MPPPEKIRLGDLLVRQALIGAEQLAVALAQQKTSGRKLGRILVDSGFVTEEQICGALARQMQIPYINLKMYNLDAKLTQLLPEAQARRFRALVLEEAAGVLRVGMADPSDLFAYDELARILKREIALAVVTESQLLATIDRVYRRTGEITQLSQELTAELAQTEADFGALLGTEAAVQNAPVVKLLQTLFEDAAQVRASDIHIEPQEHKLHVRFRIDGVLHLQTEADSKIAPALVLRLKLMSGLDISEKRLPQDGRFHVDIKGNPLDVRISTMPTQFGESVVMRLLNQATGLLSLDRIGMPARMMQKVRSTLNRSSGMILVTGPTGSGKTTALYAALNEINAPDRKIITVEDPVEYRLPGINQVQVHDKIELGFERVLRAALRQDPDVILVGEMRDRTTAEIGLRAAMTGHLVLSTLHTNDAASTPVRLLDMGVPPYMVAMSLNLVLAQRLVRLVCEDCHGPHTPTPQEHAWLAHHGGEETLAGAFARGMGCSRCNGTGYAGRTAVYEMLEMTQALVDAANRGSPIEFVQIARDQIGRATLMHNAMALAATGRTTIEEAMRVSMQLDVE
ncbi:MAG TPA: GspE/PulE family protein [Albitalea sp.]|nr:GspE/PulE family protein [Albitalea sp.]